MKRIISLFLIAIIMLPAVNVYAEVEPSRLTVEAAMDIAVSNSKQAILDDFTIKVRESSLEKVLYDAKYAGTYANIPEYILSYRMKTVINPLEAQYNLDIAKRTREENLKSLKLSVYKSIMNVLLRQVELDLETEEYAILKENTERKYVQYEDGKIVESDIIDAEYALETKALEIEAKKQAHLVSILELKKLLNMPLNDETIEIDHEVTFEELPQLDMDKVIETAIENSFNIYRLNLNLDIKQKIMDYTEEYLDEGHITYDNNRLSLETAILDLEDAKLKLEVDVRNSWNNLLNLQDSVILAKKYEEIASRKFDICKYQYENGMVSRETYLAEKERHLNAAYRTYAAIHNYNLAKADFERLTTISLSNVDNTDSELD